MEKNILLLVDTERVSEEEAASALKAANGELEAARKLLKLTINIIKLYFKSRTKGLEGYVFIMIDLDEYRLLKLNTAAVSANKEGLVSLDLPWQDFRNKLENLNFSEHSLKVLAEELYDVFKNFIQSYDELNEEIIDCLKEGWIDKLQEKLSNEINKTVIDPEIKCEISYERIRKLDFLEQEGEISNNSDSDDLSPVKAERNIVICNPVLSPTKGVPAEYLIPGTKVYITIADKYLEENSKLATLVAKSKQEDGLKATIIEVKKNSPDTVDVILKLTNNIYAKFGVSNAVKVKVDQPDIDLIKKQTEFTEGFDYPIVFLVAIVILLILSIIYLLFFY